MLRDALIWAVEGNSRVTTLSATEADLSGHDLKPCCHTRLSAQGVIVPPLPEKSAMQKYQMATEFIDTRRRALQVRGSVRVQRCDSRKWASVAARDATSCKGCGRRRGPAHVLVAK